MRKDSCRCSDKVLSPATMALLISYPQVRVKLLSVQISTVIWAGFQGSAQEVEFLFSLKSSTMLSRSKVAFSFPSHGKAWSVPVPASKPACDIHPGDNSRKGTWASQTPRDEEGGAAQVFGTQLPPATWTTSLGEVGPPNTHHWLLSLKQPLKQVKSWPWIIGDLMSRFLTQGTLWRQMNVLTPSPAF